MESAWSFCGDWSHRNGKSASPSQPPVIVIICKIHVLSYLLTLWNTSENWKDIRNMHHGTLNPLLKNIWKFNIFYLTDVKLSYLKSGVYFIKQHTPDPFNTDLFWWELVLPHMNQFTEHAVWPTTVLFPQSAIQRKLIIRHTHVLLPMNRKVYWSIIIHWYCMYRVYVMQLVKFFFQVNDY